MNYTDKQLEDLINNVYAGIITPKNLPLDLYNVTLDRLTAAIVKGFGTDFAEDSADALLFDYYKHNIAIFSGAKTFQQVKDMTNLVMTSDGVKRDFSEFKKIIKGDQFHDGLFKTYNENYLKTEFNTAFATAQMGREWNEFVQDADVFPLLKYITVHDDRVRHNHRPFDGVIRPVGDSFWDTHTPPNGFNCRCHVIQLEEGEETTDTQIKNMPEVDSPLFAFNPGKSGRIFDESIHPYIKNIEERYKVDAAKNWGLPTPPKPTKKIKK
jgi:SPP1 gp7 family putative phage head morphogenesis protein